MRGVYLFWGFPSTHPRRFTVSVLDQVTRKPGIVCCYTKGPPYASHHSLNDDYFKSPRPIHFQRLILGFHPRCSYFMAGDKGFEPLTIRVRVCRATNCANPQYKNSVFTDGWGGRIRTYEYRSQSPAPYRLATPQYGPESWNRTNNVPQPSRNRTGWAITPLYHFSLSPYMQGTLTIALPIVRFSKFLAGKMGLEPITHRCVFAVCAFIYNC